MGRSIVSIFPEFEDTGDEVPLQYYHSRVIYSREVGDRTNKVVIIMWMKTNLFSADLANHFVP